MIPIVKGHEPAALHRSQERYPQYPDATFDYAALRGEPKQKGSGGLGCRTRSSPAHIACVASALTNIPQRSNI